MGSQRAMADGDDVVRADEDVRLAELDVRRRSEPLRRPQHDEHRAFVDSRASAAGVRCSASSMARSCRLELTLDLAEQRLVWLVEAQPDELVLSCERLLDVLNREIGYTDARRICRAVDDPRCAWRRFHRGQLHRLDYRPSTDPCAANPDRFNDVPSAIGQRHDLDGGVGHRAEKPVERRSAPQESQRERALWPKMTCVTPSRWANAIRPSDGPIRLDAHDRRAEALGQPDVLASASASWR